MMPATSIKMLGCALAALIMMGCSVHHIGPAPNCLYQIGEADIQQADAYRKMLPDYLNLPFQQVDVDAGPRFTRVTIYRMSAEADRQRIARQLQAISDANPQLNALKWEFR